MRCLPPEMVAAPAVDCVSLADAKAHLRVDDSEEDGLIGGYIAAAVQRLDGYGGILGRALMKQTWRQFLQCWPGSREIELALAPVISIVSLSARGWDGQAVTIDPAGYRLVGAAGVAPRIVLDAPMPAHDCAPDAVTVTFVAGYGDAPEALPAPIKSAILLMVGDLYRFRDSVVSGVATAVPMSTTVMSLLGPYRRKML